MLGELYRRSEKVKELLTVFRVTEDLKPISIQKAGPTPAHRGSTNGIR